MNNGIFRFGPFDGTVGGIVPDSFKLSETEASRHVGIVQVDKLSNVALAALVDGEHAHVPAVDSASAHIVPPPGSKFLHVQEAITVDIVKNEVDLVRWSGCRIRLRIWLRVCVIAVAFGKSGVTVASTTAATADLGGDEIIVIEDSAVAIVNWVVVV